MKLDLSDLCVAIPYRFDTEDRLENLCTTLRYFDERTQGVQIVLIENGPFPTAREMAAEKRLTYHFVELPAEDDPFHRTRLLNMAFETLTDRTFVASYDADVLLHPEGLEQAMQSLRAGARIGWPHCGMFLDIKGDLRRRFMETLDFSLLPDGSGIRKMGDYTPEVFCQSLAALGGVVIFHRATLMDFGGYDENFISWGWEDNEIVERFAKFGHIAENFTRWPFYHMHHRRGPDSKGSNPYYWANMFRFRKMRRMRPATLRRRVDAGGTRCPEIPPPPFNILTFASNIRRRFTGTDIT